MLSVRLVLDADPFGREPTPEEVAAFLADPAEGPGLPLSRRLGSYLIVGDKPPIFLGDDQPTLPLCWAGGAQLTELVRACRLHVRKQYGLSQRGQADEEAVEPLVLHLCDLPEVDYLDLASVHREQEAQVIPVRFVVGLSTLSLIIDFYLPRDRFDEASLEAFFRQRPLRRSSISRIERLSRTSTEDGWQVEFSLRPRSESVAEVITPAVDMLHLAEIAGEHMQAADAFKLIQSGRPDLILGIQESAWLDAKSQPYQLDSVAGKIELAQDVARFANSEGGLLLIGAKTRKSGEGEILHRLIAIPAKLLRKKRYLDVIDARVVPLVEGLQVHYQGTEPEGGVLAILVPPQSPDILPFVVHGAVVAGKVEGSFFSIVRRRGDASVAIGAHEVHGWLAQGRSRHNQEFATSTRGSAAADHVDLNPESQIPSPSFVSAPTSDQLSPSAAFFQARLASFPVYGPQTAASPGVAGGWPRLLVRSVAAYALRAETSPVKIEPAHRRQLVEILSTASFADLPASADWEAPHGSFQTTANGLYTRDLGSGRTIKCWLQLPTLHAPTVRVVVDAYIDVPSDLPAAFEWPMPLATLVRLWADMLELAGVSIRQGLMPELVPSGFLATTVEYHLEAGPTSDGYNNLGSCLDLTSLGAPTRQPPIQGMWAGPANSLETVGATELALIALRENALDWGFLDPDPGIEAIRIAMQ